MSPATQVRSWLIFAAVFLLLLYLLRSILLPFVAAMGVAYMLDPLADWLERRGMSRTLATSAITVVFLLVSAVLLLVLLPVLQSQIIAFIRALPDLLDALREQAEALVFRVRSNLSPGDLGNLRDVVSEYAGRAVDWMFDLVAQIWSGGAAFFNIMSLLLITPIISFYLLRDWDLIVARIDGWLPRQHVDDIRALAREIDKRLAGFVRGQLLVATILGTGYAIGLSLVGLQFGLVIGLAAGILSLIPFVGTATGFVLSMAVALFQYGADWLMLGLVAGVFILGQAIEGNFLTPRLVGNRVGVHPVWIIFALMAGGTLFGFVGVLLAVPAAAVIGVLSRYGLERYRDSQLYASQADSGEGE